ncbi:COMD9 protein, partial [Polypterus senegalus]
MTTPRGIEKIGLAGISRRMVFARLSRGRCSFIQVVISVRNAEILAETYRMVLWKEQQLLGALHCLSRHVLFHGMASPEEIFTVFPASFHPNLKNLLTKILLEQSPAWRNDVLAKQISLPQLVDMDWRVDIKTSSDSVSRMAMPTCLVQIKVQDDPGLCQSKPVESTVMVELSKETLETMLDGLGKIRDQLSTVANK